MQRLVLRGNHHGRFVVAPPSLLGLALCAVFTIAGCGPPQPKTEAPTATSDAPAAPAGGTETKGGAPPATNTAGGGETAEAPAKADNPADVAALKAAGAQLRSSGGSVIAVDLSEQNGTDEILLHLKGLPALRQLILAGPSYSPEGLAHLGEVVQLKRLELEATRTNDAVLAALKPLVNLELIKLFKPTSATRASKTSARLCG